MVPSRNNFVAADVRLKPLSGVQIKLENLLILELVVPSSIDIEFSLKPEHGVSSSRFRWVSVVLDLLPSVFVDVKGIQIVEGISFVLKSSLSSKDINLVVE